MKLKTCPKCGLEKALSQFSKNKAGWQGVCSWCKECMREAVQAWNKKNREYKNAYNHKHFGAEYQRKRKARKNIQR